MMTDVDIDYDKDRQAECGDCICYVDGKCIRFKVSVSIHSYACTLIEIKPYLENARRVGFLGYIFIDKEVEESILRNRSILKTFK